ncbi:hypothetical protein JJQ72_02250 [Paenibacillus sp. F411]|uniref:hypothetical protein n=1 Tax=Paenibacillus sp. F411 TaxID=2820239 RepID=UPI001AAECD1E|nr:hypothetical protein [Paenibacillus sp. F411]MBO2942806.1 hypothetical protein [Paenibacillus sp. F411]
MDPQEVGVWISENMLDTEAWDRATEQKQVVAVVQAERNLARWYPEIDPMAVSIVASQTVWELEGVDPALKYQKHNVKTVSDNGESISYKEGERPDVAPDVRSLLGPTADELAEEEAEAVAQLQYGGALV